MNWTLLKILYKVYFSTGIIPVLSRLKKAKKVNKDECFATVQFIALCEYAGFEPEQSLEEIERYTTWTDELIKVWPNYTNGF